MMLDNSGRDAKTASPTILVIDDDPIALEELGEILELAELRSVSAGNTEEALMLLNARPDIGIVVTDVHIREDDGQMKNGIEFVAEAQRRFSERDMRFIVISGDAGAASASVNTGVTDFLTKPMIAEELLAAIKEAADAKVLKASETDPNAFLVRMFNKKVESLQRAQASLVDNENAMAKARDETRRLRETDPESGLINGVQLAREIDALESKKGALITFELGGLANIRDGSDHAVAVALILDYAERLRDMAGPDDLVARIGRQEIALYLADGDDREELAAIAHRARQRISRSRVAEDLNVLVTPTAGIAMRDARGQDGDALMAESAFALRHALADRPGATSFYEVGTRSNSDRNQALAVKLRKGIEKRHVRPWFQPQIDLKTGEIVGWEALARWRDPEDGMRSPAEFLPLAKEVGLMRDLDLAIQIQALTAMRELERFGLAGHRMSINVTSDELKDASFLDCLKIELERVGFGFDRVAIEILESTMLDDPEAEPIKTGIERLSALGASIELDDFGTGHAGLSSLRDLPVNRVKIDRSFVDGIDKKPELQTFSRALIGLAKALGVEVLAEGVERQEELDWLRKEGCDVVQGYFTGRPMPLDDIAAWAETRLAS